MKRLKLKHRHGWRVGVAWVLGLSLLGAGLGMPQVEAAGETVVAQGEDQYPSDKTKGAYWYDAVWSDLKDPYWNKSRVVEDRTLPARAFFIPADTLEQAQRKSLDWRELSRWQSLNGNWFFHLVEKPADVVKYFHEEGFDPKQSGWPTLEVPSNWQLQPNEIGDEPMYSNWYYPWGQKSWTIFGEPNIDKETVNYSLAKLSTAPEHYNPVGHYVRDFELNPDYADHRVILNFQGVESAFYVYLNGHYVGYSEDSFTQHEFDITDYVHRTGPNRLAVLVYRWSDGSLLENQDLVNYSGIFRDLGLIYRSSKAPLLDFSNEMTLNDDGTVTFMTKLDTPDHVKATVSLYDPQGELVKTVSASPEDNGGLFAQLDVANPQLWSPENPVLYHQVIRTETAEGELGEYVGWDVGLREISLMTVENGKTTYALNNQPIVFKGVNRHELNNEKGRVMTLETLHRDLQLMRQHNVNAIRTSHYPNNIDLYLLANEYGLMIMDEANLETHAAGGTGGIPYSVETFRYPSVHRAKNMYERDKNFACVVAWSNGNESIFFLPSAINNDYAFRLMYNYIKERDQKRPIVLERDVRKGISDIRSRMYWPAKDHGSILSIFESIEKNDELILEGADERPYLQVEYAHSMGNSLGYFKEYWDVWRKYPHAMGGFIWDWVDQSPLFPLPKGKQATGLSYTAQGEKVPYGGTHYYAYGGDWAKDKNNNFNNFMDNGLIASDRTPHDSHQQLKHIQQDVLFSNYDPEASTVEIKNEFAFTPLSHYDIVVKLKKDGHWMTLKNGQQEQVFPVAVGPRQQQTVSVPALSDLVDSDQPLTQVKDAQYYLYFDVKLKQDVGLWGKAGDSIAFGEFKLNEVDLASEPLAVPSDWEMTIDDTSSKDELTISSPRATWTFDLKQGQWTQFAKDGVNFFARPDDGSPRFYTTDKREMKPGFYANFWRPPVDNDRENGWLNRVGRWREANFWRRWVKVNHTQIQPGVVQVVVTSKFSNNSDLTEIYTLYADGNVRYVQTLDPTRRSEIPAIGTMMELPQQFNHLTFYGRGPATTFVDRYEGYPVGVYEETVDFRSIGDYVKPQENGNHIGVYWAKLTDDQGRGLFVKPLEGTLEVMGSAYNQYDITQAAHPYELSATKRTYWRINQKTQGVGGENSWGARPLPYAEIQPKPVTWGYDLFPVGTSEVKATEVKPNKEEARADAATVRRTRRDVSEAREMTYPEIDPSLLYRVNRQIDQWIQSVEYNWEEESHVVLRQFTEGLKAYTLRNPLKKSFEPATINLKLTEAGEKRFTIRSSETLDEEKRQKRIQIDLLEKDHPETVAHSYTFTFELAPIALDDLVAGAQYQENQKTGLVPLPGFKLDQFSYQLPFQPERELKEVTAELILQPGAQKNYEVRKTEVLTRTTQGHEIKTVTASIYPKEAAETAEPLYTYEFVFRGNPLIDDSANKEKTPESTQPDEGEEPTPQPDPNEEGQPTSPVTPEKPDEGEEPTPAPVTPGKPDPNEEGQPTLPVTPGKPDPNEEGQPTSPVTPEKPDEGGESTPSPVTPEQPTAPTQPRSGEQPVFKSEGGLSVQGLILEAKDVRTKQPDRLENPVHPARKSPQHGAKNALPKTGQHASSTPASAAFWTALCLALLALGIRVKAKQNPVK